MPKEDIFITDLLHKVSVNNWEPGFCPICYKQLSIRREKFGYCSKECKKQDPNPNDLKYRTHRYMNICFGRALDREPKKRGRPSKKKRKKPPLQWSNPVRLTEENINLSRMTNIEGGGIFLCNEIVITKKEALILAKYIKDNPNEPEV